MHTEEWRTVADTDGMFEVSNYGRVRSYLRDGVTVKLYSDRKGYAHVSIKRNGCWKTPLVHRLVALAFIPNPNGYDQVNHLDGHKGNNCVENLEWCTCLQNAQHAMRTGLWTNVLAASKRTNDKRKRRIEAELIKTGDRFRFFSMRDAERACNTRHINEVLSGKRTQANGFRFWYA